MTADRAILLSAMVTAGSTIGSAIITPTDSKGRELKGHSTHLSPRLLIGTGLAFTALAMLGEVAPAVAVPLSATVAVSALMWYGIPVLETAMNKE